MLTRNRGAMAHQAIACFRAQTYSNKRLLILDSSEPADGTLPYGQVDATSVWMPDMCGKTVGELRNAANWCASGWGEAEIIIHLDSDDFSHPARFSEQVSLLRGSSGADCVGFNEMLFWRQSISEAWLYRNPDPHYALGTSLCYWRQTWERKPFEATSQGEDQRLIAGLNVVSSENDSLQAAGPRMIARIHPGNTSTAYKPEAMQRESQKRNGMWKRVPEWDKYCDGIFRSA